MFFLPYNLKRRQLHAKCTAKLPSKQNKQTIVCHSKQAIACHWNDSKSCERVISQSSATSWLRLVYHGSLLPDNFTIEDFLHTSLLMSMYLITVDVYVLFRYWCLCVTSLLMSVYLLHYWCLCIYFTIDVNVFTSLLMSMYLLHYWCLCTYFTIDVYVLTSLLMSMYLLQYWCQCTYFTIDVNANCKVTSSSVFIFLWLVLEKTRKYLLVLCHSSPMNYQTMWLSIHKAVCPFTDLIGYIFILGETFNRC